MTAYGQGIQVTVYPGPHAKPNQFHESGEVTNRSNFFVKTNQPFTSFDNGGKITFQLVTSGDFPTNAKRGEDFSLSALECTVRGGWCRLPLKVLHNKGCDFDDGFKMVHLKVTGFRNLGIDSVKGNWKLKIWEGETRRGCPCPFDPKCGGK